MTYHFPIREGDRVAIAPHHDLWMAGCRFGTVTYIGESGRFYTLRLDTGREVTLAKDDLLGAVGEHKAPESATPSTDGPINWEVTETVTITSITEMGAMRSTDGLNWAGFSCPEFEEDGSCIHSDHMAAAEGAVAAELDEEQTCIHDQCGYGDCSWLQESPRPGMCQTHGNGEGRCQRDPDHCVCRPS